MNRQCWLAGVLAGAAICCAAPANADDARVRDYIIVNSGRICQVLKEFPNDEGILGLGEAITDEGFTAFEAGRIIGDSVLMSCPQYSGLILRFTAKYLRGEVTLT